MVPRHRKVETCRAQSQNQERRLRTPGRGLPRLQNCPNDSVSRLVGFRGKWEQMTGNQEPSRPIWDTQHNPTTHFLPSRSASRTQCIASSGSGDTGHASPKSPIHISGMVAPGQGRDFGGRGHSWLPSLLIHHGLQEADQSPCARPVLLRRPFCAFLLRF